MANKEKRVPQQPRLNVEPNDEQKKVRALFYNHDVNFVHGDFGSGKSLIACYIALMSYRKREFNKIWITRPMLKNNLAALPGTLEEKMAPYVFPILQNLNVCQAKNTTEKMINDGDIEIMPIEVAKGVTFIESVVIVDEYQDMDYQDFRTILTRLGKDSKIIFCGSKEQIDDKIGKNSCIHQTIKLEKFDKVGYTTLSSNHRNEVLTDIIKFLEK
jgi:phosphate starvation-inducible PhoH-like protein